MLAAAALVGQQVAARATRDAFFLTHHDVARLPLAMAAAAVLSLAAVAVSSRAMTRWPPAQVVPAVLAASAVLLLLEWLLSMVSAPAAAIALYLHLAVFGATLVSGFWLLLGERFDPHSAKRALGPVGAGANAGAVLGGLIAWYAGRRMGASAMLPVLAALTGLCWLGVRRVVATPALASPPNAGPPPSGTGVLRDAPYLRGVAVLVALGAFAEALLDYVLSAQAVARFDSGPRLMTFFAAFHTGVKDNLGWQLSGAGLIKRGDGSYGIKVKDGQTATIGVKLSASPDTKPGDLSDLPRNFPGEDGSHGGGDGGKNGGCGKQLLALALLPTGAYLLGQLFA